MVVESGLARCPRCVSVADYVFIESGSGRDHRALRYEVRCRKCGEYYGEDSGPASRHPVVVAEPPIIWPRDREPVEPVDWRAELNRHLSDVSHQLRRLSFPAHRLQQLSAAAQRLRQLSLGSHRFSTQVDVMVGRTDIFAPKRWFGRESGQGGQTGG